MELPYIEEVRRQDPKVDKVLRIYFKKLVDAEVWEKALNDASAHSPDWHGYPLLRHIEKTVEAATQISANRQIDLRAVMAIHDVGKIEPFIKYCQRPPKASSGYHYSEHEELSKKIADKASFDPEILYLIKNHSLSYSGIKPEDLIKIKKLSNNTELLIKLLLVFACDAFGKGWVKNSIWQRKMIADFVSQVCQLAQLPDWVNEIASQLILETGR